METAGLTPSEKYLKTLCDRTFLKLWSFSRLFNDEGLLRNGGQGKEICDLLVVFDNNVLIFSDKCCAFPHTDDINLDWSRWFKRAVLKSADQIYGAESWLRRFPRRIFQDPTCHHPFPLQLPNTADMQIHRIVVAHGVSSRCREYFGSSGTLMIDTTLNGPDHYKNPAAVQPFTVGHVNRSKGFVHILDDESLDLVMRTLDTISDFVAYLEQKEMLLVNKNVMAVGEEEMLGRYMMYSRTDGSHHFNLPDEYDFLSIDVGHWHDFCNHPRRQNQIAADKVSYSWDAIIEKFTHHCLSDTQYYSSHPERPYEIELGLRQMAAESRVRRRFLSQCLLDLLLQAQGHHGRATRIILPAKPSDPLYVFLTLSQSEDMTFDEYRTARRNLLAYCCMAAMAKFPEAKKIVGLATEPGINPSVSEDLIYLDVSDFSASQIEEAMKIATNLGLFQNLQRFEKHIEEYPKPRRLPTQLGIRGSRIGRNAPCPCGSGRKYKKCCQP